MSLLALAAVKKHVFPLCRGGEAGGWRGRRLIAPFSGSRRFRTGEVGARRLSAGERRSINAFSDGRWFSLSLSLLLVPRFRRSIWPNKIERLPIRHFFLFPKNEKFDRWSFQRKGKLPSRSCPLDS